MDRSEAGEARAAGRRALGNIVTRSSGEIVGKLATFLLMSVLAREAGEQGLGIYLLALAFAQVALLPIELGLDRLLVRRVAKDRAAADDLYFNALAIKLALAVPVLGVVAVAVPLLGMAGDTRTATLIACGGTLLESLARTAGKLFTAFERGGQFAIVLIAQRSLAAVLGIVALTALDGGPVEVTVAYAIGAALAVVLSILLVGWRIGLPARRVTPGGWPALLRASAPFAAGDALGLLLYRLDTLLLGALASTAAVGVYGAAYRLFDATLFLTYAMAGAFVSMFTYLGPRTEPTVHGVFASACKVALVLLVPVAAVFAALADPIVTFVFGPRLADAAASLVLLGPAVPLLGLYTLANVLISSRMSGQAFLPLNAGVLALNGVLNLVLIPPLGPQGAALAMLLTTAAGAAAGLAMAVRALDHVPLGRLFAGPLLAGGAAVAIMLVLPVPAVPAALAGLAAYAALVYVVERRVAPADVAFVTGMLRRPGPRRAATTASA